MGGSSSDTTKTTVRYAWYIEGHHQTFLNMNQGYVNYAISRSPYANFTVIGINDAFFGVGYMINSFPSLYDMYGKFMAGLDIKVLWDQLYQDSVYGPVVQRLVSTDSVLLDNDLNTELVKVNSGMNNMNAVMSTGFMAAEANMRNTKLKLANKENASLQVKFVDISQRRWEGHLNWNKMVISTYAELFKHYYSSKLDVDDFNYGIITKNLLWPFTVLDFQRAAVGVLQGATNTSSTVKGPSKTVKAVSGMVAGASAGSAFGPWGTVIGGVVGLAYGLSS